MRSRRAAGPRATPLAPPLLLALALGGCDDGPARTPRTYLLEPVASVGTIDGPPEQVLGGIVDVKAAPDGSFFVIDPLGATLAWFDAEGTYLGGVGARGEGPGELSRPTALAVAGELVAVMDVRNARLNLYRPGADGVAFVEAFRGGFSGLDASRNLCALSGRWYVRSHRNGLMIHAFDPAGAAVHSFQPPAPVAAGAFGRFTEAVSVQIGAGYLLCLEDPAAVVSVEQFSSTVRAYTPDGDVVWERRMPGIRAVEFYVDESGLALTEEEEDGRHLGLSVVRWSDESVLAQYAVVLPGPRDGDYHGVVSIELSLATGEELGRTEALPLISDTMGDLVYTFRNQPYPEARVFRRGG